MIADKLSKQLNTRRTILCRIVEVCDPPTRKHQAKSKLPSLFNILAVIMILITILHVFAHLTEEFADSITGLDEVDDQESPEGMAITTRDYFDDLDVDGDGVLTREEILTPTFSLLESSFGAIDEDNDGIINASEFEVFKSDLLRLNITAEEVDVNGDNIVSKEEAIAFSKRAYEINMIHNVDKNNDGIITFDEMLSHVMYMFYSGKIKEEKSRIRRKIKTYEDEEMQ